MYDISTLVLYWRWYLLLTLISYEGKSSICENNINISVHSNNHLIFLNLKVVRKFTSYLNGCVMSSFNVFSQGCITFSNIITIFTTKGRQFTTFILVKTKWSFRSINFSTVTPKNWIIKRTISHVAFAFTRHWSPCSYIRWCCFGYGFYFVKYGPHRLF